MCSLDRPDVPVASLVRAGALFDFEPGAVRVALSRLRQEGLVESVDRGQWRLARAAEEVASHVALWREREHQVRPWEDGWIGVSTGGLSRTDRRALRRRSKALALWGFQRLRPGLWVRPDNRVQRAPEVRERLVALGLEDSAPVFEMGHLGPQQQEALRLWSGPDLTESYVQMRSELSDCAAALPDMSAEEAAREAFLLEGRVVRLLAYDPLLPEPIVDVAARSALIEQMRGFDRVTRQLWDVVLDAAA